jgi:hypothetical protein
MGIRHRFLTAAVGSSLLLFAGGARADEQAAGSGGGGTLVGVGTSQGAAPTPAAAAPAPVAVAYTPARRENRLPVAYVDRGITNPAEILSPELQFNIAHPEVLAGGFGFGGGGRGGVNTIGSAAVGSGYSITDDLGVRGTAFVLQFNQPAQLAAAGLGFTYRFIRGSFEMGVAVDWIYQTPSNGNGNAGQDIIPSLPMHVHFGHVVRMDLTPALPISTAGVYVPYFGGIGGGKTTVNFDVPLEFSFQIVEQLRLGALTGFNMTFNPDSTATFAGSTFGDFFGIPLGLELGATVVGGAKGPVLDMTPFFVWSYLLVPGIQNPGNVVQSGLWTTGINFTAYVYL